MTRNPFTMGSAWLGQLSLDLCRQIHYAALRAACRGVSPESLPHQLNVALVRQRARRFGPDVFLIPENEVEKIFTGVTIPVYQAIEQLYCDRLERSIKLIERLLNRMADQAAAPPIAYEAIWAICLSMHERRRINTDVTKQMQDMTWALIARPLKPRILFRDVQIERPCLVLIVAIEQEHVVAFRLCAQDEVVATGLLALYDAIVSERRPDPNGAAGLIWPLPRKLLSAVAIPTILQSVCQQLGIAVSSLDMPDAVPSFGIEEWAADLADAVLPSRTIVKSYDEYLHRRHGYSQGRHAERCAYAWAQSVGYQRDPVWQFPMLVNLLPRRDCYVSYDGSIEHDGLHYESRLLDGWVGEQVGVQISPQAESTAWVSLDGELMCLARARELRRQGDSYWRNRPGR